MKIDLKKLNASAHASIPFDETIDLTDEKLYGAKPFQSPVHIKGVVSNESGVVRLAGSIETIYSTECARCLKPLEIPLSAEADMMLSDDPEAEEEDDLFVLTSDSVDPADVLVPALPVSTKPPTPDISRPSRWRFRSAYCTATSSRCSTRPRSST